MARVITEAEWLRSAGELTVSPEGLPADQVAATTRMVAELIALARALPRCPHGAHHPAGGPDPRCAFADLPAGARACTLAADLAALPPTHAPSPPVIGEVAGQFLQAVRTAAPAVYLCRRVRHIGGHCWFREPELGEDLCGRVLALAHRL